MKLLFIIQQIDVLLLAYILLIIYFQNNKDKKPMQRKQ